MSDSGFSFRSSGIFGLILTILGIVALYYIAKGAFWVLTWLSPVLLIATLVLDYQVVINYLKMLWALILRNPIFGIFASVLSFFGLPVVIFFLFGRAWFGYYARKKQNEQFEYYRNNKQTEQRSDEFVPYEEITDEHDDALSDLFEINRNELPKQPQNDVKQ